MCVKGRKCIYYLNMVTTANIFRHSILEGIRCTCLHLRTMTSCRVKTEKREANHCARWASMLDCLLQKLRDFGNKWVVSGSLGTMTPYQREVLMAFKHFLSKEFIIMLCCTKNDLSFVSFSENVV